MPDELHEQFASLMQSHCRKLLAEQADHPGICSTIRELMEADVMRRSTELAVELAQEVLETGGTNNGITKENVGEDFLLIGTFFVTAKVPVVAHSFSGGYHAWLTNALQRSDRLPGHPALAHWIFTMNPPNVVTHLTLTQKDKSKYSIAAWDFFNPSEMQRLYGSDRRPEVVKQQWREVSSLHGPPKESVSNRSTVQDRIAGALSEVDTGPSPDRLMPLVAIRLQGKLEDSHASVDGRRQLVFPFSDN